MARHCIGVVRRRRLVVISHQRLRIGCPRAADGLDPAQRVVRVSGYVPVGVGSGGHPPRQRIEGRRRHEPHLNGVGDRAGIDELPGRGVVEIVFGDHRHVGVAVEIVFVLNGVAASVVTLEHLTAAAVEGLNERGERLRRELRAVIAGHGLPLTVTGAGSLLGLHADGGPINDFRATWAEDPRLRHGVFLGLMNEGVLTDPRGAACLSTASTDADVVAFTTGLDRVLERLTA